MIKTNKGFNSRSPSVKVSLCLIVKNEAERLGTCLKSAMGFVDEIIVVDTGSTDKTIAIAKKFGAKVYKFDWCDNFSAPRNYSLQKAKGEWILVLDADEVLDARTIPLLQEVISQPNCLVVNLNRWEIGTKRSPYSFVSRLFRRHQHIYFTGLYHELVDESVEKLMKENLQEQSQWQVVTISQVAIHHYGYQTSEINKKQKFEFAQRLMKKHLQEYPDDIYMYSKLGALQIENGELESGLELLQAGLEILVDRHDSSFSDGSSNQSQTLFELNYHLGLAYGGLRQEVSNLETAKRYYQIALEVDVSDLVKLPAFNNLGNLFQVQGDYKHAIDMYQKVVEIAPDFAIAYFNLGIAYKSTLNYLAAITAYERALEINPEYAEAYQNLGVALLQTAQTQKAIIAFKQAIKFHIDQQNLAIAAELTEMMQELGLL